MNDNDYLKKVLKSQTLAEDSEELKALRKHRDAVEKLLRKSFGFAPTIRYGGSMAKGTMNKVSYDLDIICYFPHDSTVAGKTLKEIYDHVCAVLEKDYFVERKASALRLRSRDSKSYKQDFHIDVVPGRYIDDTKTDVFLHQEGGTKEYLKTNLETHINHVKDSGVVEAIRLMKLWRVWNGVVVKPFVLDLLTIKLLDSRKSDDLTSQLEHVWQEFRDHPEELAVEDPANPKGNDLSDLMDAARWSLSSVARSTLTTLENGGWEAIFGKVDDLSDDDRSSSLRGLVGTVQTPTKPWCG